MEAEAYTEAGASTGHRVSKASRDNILGTRYTDSKDKCRCMIGCMLNLRAIRIVPPSVTILSMWLRQEQANFWWRGVLHIPSIPIKSFQSRNNTVFG